MLALLSIIIILLGIYLIVSGLKEEWPEFEEWGEERKEVTEKQERKETKPKREVKGGGVILIGPIPIVFGDSKYAFLSLVLAIILMLLSIALILML